MRMDREMDGAGNLEEGSGNYRSISVASRLMYTVYALCLRWQDTRSIDRFQFDVGPRFSIQAHS